MNSVRRSRKKLLPKVEEQLKSDADNHAARLLRQTARRPDKVNRGAAYDA